MFFVCPALNAIFLIFFIDGLNESLPAAQQMSAPRRNLKRQLGDDVQASRRLLCKQLPAEGRRDGAPKLPEVIRKVVYTTTAIESVNCTIRKITRIRQSFPATDARDKARVHGLAEYLEKMDDALARMGGGPQSIRDHLRNWRAAMNRPFTQNMLQAHRWKSVLTNGPNINASSSNSPNKSTNFFRKGARIYRLSYEYGVRYGFYLFYAF